MTERSKYRTRRVCRFHGFLPRSLLFTSYHLDRVIIVLVMRQVIRLISGSIKLRYRTEKIICADICTASILDVLSVTDL